MTKLKPCPFCGEEPTTHVHSFSQPQFCTTPDFVTIGCGDCGIEIQRESEAGAIRDWNRRAK